MSDYVILCTTDRLGTGDEKLGRILMKSFLDKLTENELPKQILLMNDGVRLAVEGSEVLPELERLTDKGVKIFSCGTCLNFYTLMEKLKIGEATNMTDTVAIVSSDMKVVKL